MSYQFVESKIAKILYKNELPTCTARRLCISGDVFNSLSELPVENDDDSEDKDDRIGSP